MRPPLSSYSSSPAKEGFFMPAQWHPQTTVWMLWPERPDNWHSNAIPAQITFLQVAIAIAHFTPVKIGVSIGQYSNATQQIEKNLRSISYALQAINLFEIESDDAWLRDTGPTFIINHQEICAIDWRFNAWGGFHGGLYSPWDKDDQIALKISNLLNIKTYSLPNFILEGGAIDVDGEGTLITTEECLLNSNRNPHLTKSQIETILCNYLNIKTIIWLKQGIAFDHDTNGHIDNICRFIKPGEVLLAWTDDPENPNYERCQSALNILSNTKDAKNRALIIHKIPIPAPIIHTTDEYSQLTIVKNSVTRGEPIAASYINFLITNQGIIIPNFNDPMDAKANQVLQSLFPNHHVITVASREIILGGGGIHCITLQQPSILPP